MPVPTGSAEIHFRFGGTACPLGAEVTIGVDLNDAALTPGDVAAIAAGVWHDTFLVEQSVSVSFDEVLVKFGPDDVGPSDTFAPGEDGATTGNCSPPNVAFLVRKATALGGRANRGRMYIPGVPEVAVDESGFVLPATITGLNAAGVQFLNDMTAADIPPVLLHSLSSLSTPIVTLSAQAKVATQRRRLR